MEKVSNIDINKPMLMSGNCRCGEIGKQTPLVDIYSKPLFIGDIVALSVYRDEDIFDDFYDFQFVCEEVGDAGTKLGIFVMGIASEHNNYDGIVTQNHKVWRVKKVKDYKDVVNGEKWGAVRAFIP